MLTLLLVMTGSLVVLKMFTTPHPIHIFNSYDADEMWGDLQENNRRTSIVELSARVSEINDIVKMIESNPSITALDIIKELNSRSKRMSEIDNLLKKTE